MLPNFYKFHIVNNTGATIQFSTDGANNTFTITAVPWKFDSNGALEYGSELTLFADPTADLTDGSSLEAAAEIDNTTNKYLGLLCRASLLTDATTSGVVDIFWEWSTDGSSGTYPSDEGDFNAEEDLEWLANIVSDDPAEDRGVNFRIE